MTDAIVVRFEENFSYLGEPRPTKNSRDFGMVFTELLTLKKKF